MDRAKAVIQVNESEIPQGLEFDSEVSIQYSTLMAEDADEVPAAVPSLVARYSDHPRKQRWAMITRIDSDDATSTFEAMAAARWAPWPSAHPTRWEADGDRSQVAWRSASVVVWVVSHGLDESEVRAFVNAVQVDE